MAPRTGWSFASVKIRTAANGCLSGWPPAKRRTGSCLAMLKLPERCRELMRLKLIEQKSYAEIRGLTGIDGKHLRNGEAMFSDVAAQCRRALPVNQPGGFDRGGPAARIQRRRTDRAGRARIVRSCRARSGSLRSVDGGRGRAPCPQLPRGTPSGRRCLAGVGTAGSQRRGRSCRPPSMDAPSGDAICPPRNRPYHRTRTLWMDLLRPVISTVATTLSLRLCYAVLTVIGSSLVLPHAQTGESPGLAVPAGSIDSASGPRVHRGAAAGDPVHAVSASRRPSPSRTTRSRASVSPSSSPAGGGPG